MRILPAVVALCAALSVNCANAALESRLGGQMVYDTDRNISWLANANLAASEDFGVRFIDLTGYASAGPALNWINAMNAANYLGFNDWRLPTTLQPDASCGTQDSLGSRGLNCSGSEMGHLFYDELGGEANQDIATTHNTNYNLFQNLQSGGFTYWSGTKAGSLGTSTWGFDFGKGSQFSGHNGNGAFMLAVRPGDVVSAVPEPESWIFMLSGLALVGWRFKGFGRITRQSVI
ncbi:MAG: DUF1566 domain-containing protein [Propionivibrio sp.]|nr:DUF1566 domain-containing protein [Propionivibrio sp.]